MKNQKTIRWGVLGLGGISHTFIAALKATDNCKAIACASRNTAHALGFAEKYGIGKACNYKQLAEDKDIDAVYIANHMSEHYDAILLCLNAGKHVLCEKSLTLNVKQSKEVFALSREKGLILMEAMWTRFLPSTLKIIEAVKGGAVGKVQLMQGNLIVPFPENSRLFNRELGGGVGLDLGVYLASFAQMLADYPVKCVASGAVRDGVDIVSNYNVTYKDGVTAVLSCASVIEERSVEFAVRGDQGTMIIPDFHHAEKYYLLKGGEKEIIDVSYDKPGFHYEIEHFNGLIRTNKKQSGMWSHKDSLSVMKVLDSRKIY